MDGGRLDLQNSDPNPLNCQFDLQNCRAMDWDDLRYVLAIARGGTLSEAARQLGVNQTTVARRLAAAEASLGTRLFVRTDGAHRPTPAGEAAIVHGEQVERGFDAFERNVTGSDAVPSGTVRVTSVPVVVNRLLVPALPEFYRRHSAVQLELMAEPRDVSLTKREADIALRLARPQDGVALARRIGQLGYAVFAPATAAANDALPWINYVDDLAHLPQARWMEEAAPAGEPLPLRVGDVEAIVHAVQSGIGKSLLPCFLEGLVPGITRLGGPEPVLSREMWLLVHPDMRPLARIGAVIAWLEEVVRRCCVAREKAARRARH
jgi:DNA-binding transcriptional LysR family regulator